MADGTIPSPSLFARIMAAVRFVEVFRQTMQPIRRPGNVQEAVFWAEVTGKVGNDFAWKQKRLKADGTWEDWPEGRTSVKYGNAVGMPGKIVRLRGQVDAAGTWRWLIDPAVFLVKVVKDGGSEGTAATPCTFTYTVNDAFTSALLKATATPERARTTVGKYIRADTNSDYGIAVWGGADGKTLILLEAFGEVPAARVCP